MYPEGLKNNLWALSYGVSCSAYKTLAFHHEKFLLLFLLLLFFFFFFPASLTITPEIYSFKIKGYLRDGVILITATRIL